MHTVLFHIAENDERASWRHATRASLKSPVTLQAAKSKFEYYDHGKTLIQMSP